jgi:hypothetical protein
MVAAQARRAISVAAERARIQWSLRVARGSVVTELLSAAVEAELLVLGKMSRGFRPARHVGSTALSMMARAPRPVLLLEPGILSGRRPGYYRGQIKGGDRFRQSPSDSRLLTVLIDPAE